MTNYDFSEKYIVKGDFSIDKAETKYDGELTRLEGEKMLEVEKKKLRELQETLYADGSQSLLIVLQAMDAAGKDSLIKHVFDGVNPQGCSVSSFKRPSVEEYGHDFLWRHYLALPEKGKIGIFNRSHYESVLSCKVHPEFNLNEKVWGNIEDFDDKFWENRYESIRNFEKHLARNGTKIVKFFLNVSEKEQKKRFLDRLNEKDKNWKFSLNDMPERELFPKYMKAFQEAINATHRDYAPWYIIPADNKWFSRVVAIEIIVEALQSMNLQYPQPSKDELARFEEIKKKLTRE